jgi:hypothetical protein
LVATALFAGGNDDAAPVAQAFFGLLAAQLDHAAPHHQRLNGGDAKLDRFLQCQVHAFATGNALRQRDSQVRFALRFGMPAQPHRRSLALLLQLPWYSPPSPLNSNIIATAQPQCARSRGARFRRAVRSGGRRPMEGHNKNGAWSMRFRTRVGAGKLVGTAWAWQGDIMAGLGSTGVGAWYAWKPRFVILAGKRPISRCPASMARPIH